ncbi:MULTISPECIES: DUF6389 family protein [unclassified Rhodococcus (in: high G+C Gram-positive bacteria)]|uniref:DUF6389 family protein n=1 Tax=unclassified Rhodococcus (in: high G+C Gram-positive bacteria) TaxID=192944 RepID=UPI0015816758|nr:DUF6389 family protein [Rhodococcus sp. W8901]QKT11447.1 hypothetical protein HUN07_12540 [Rhodococcus sp. W8901]
MNRTEYLSELATVLGRYTETAAQRISEILDACPTEATALWFDVFPDQDGEGTFDVWARFDGPDAFVLNRPIDDHRHLFGVVHTEDGLDPDVPLWPTRNTPFCIQDAVVDAAATWLTTLWSRVGEGRSRVPWHIEGDDGYGTITPLLFTPPTG